MHRRCDLALWKLMNRQEGNKHGFGPPLLQLELSRTTDKFHAEWERRLSKGNRKPEVFQTKQTGENLTGLGKG